MAKNYYSKSEYGAAVKFLRKCQIIGSWGDLLYSYTIYISEDHQMWEEYEKKGNSFSWDYRLQLITSESSIDSVLNALCLRREDVFPITWE